ncbi:MAG: pyridoxal phosphate-dependent aminotransferase [Lysobacterales bacterium]
MTPQSKLPRVGTTIFTVMSQLAAEQGAINLGQGFPDFEGPQSLKDALARHTNSGRNQYAPMTGIPALRQEIARKTEFLYGCTVDAEREVTVTSGATEALFAAIAAMVRPGEEVIVFDPCYDSYEPAIELQGATAVRLALQAPEFGLPWDALATAITPRTRMILINSPQNPTSAALSMADLDRLADLVEGTDICILSDEVYEHILFDGRQHACVVAHSRLRSRSFAVSSFGKTYHITGWKIGYCIAPPALSDEFRKVHQYLTFSSFHPAQAALADQLAGDRQHYLELPAFYQAKRDLFAQALAGSRFGLLPVAGSYFQLVDYSAISDLPDLEFCRWLTCEHKVAAIPLSPFCAGGRSPGPFVRLCFAKSDQTLLEAAERLCRV